MSNIAEKTIRAKDGSVVTIRTAIPADAANLLEHVYAIFAEPEFVLSTLEDFHNTEEQEASWLEMNLDDPGKLVIVAEAEGQIIGMLDFRNGGRKRIAHLGELGMSVNKAWRDRRVGRALLTTLIQWARGHPVIEKVCLEVFTNNARAIALYKSLGFREEGRLRREIKLGPGEYVDTLRMALFTGSQDDSREGKEMADDRTEVESANLSVLSDLCTPWCIHAVATLRIADHIAAGNTDIKALARSAECEAGFLQRVLRHLVGKGVFTEPAPGQFALNRAAQELQGFGLNLDGFGGRMAHAWGTLLTAVRTGKPAYHEMFGLPFWEDLQAHPDIAASFDALMGPAGHGIPDPEVLLTGDWEEVKTVVDVGGGTGALLAEILRAHPHIQGTLVDSPGTVARAEALLQAAGVSERVRMVGQSFFDPLPAGADLYLLKSILNDWPDREARLLLRRCAEAARPGGRIVILGGVSADERADPELLMMVLLGSGNRTLKEFGELAAEASLKVHAAGQLPSGRFAVECRPL